MITEITFVKVDILDAKPIPYFRRNGPLSNVTLPYKEFLFLSSNGYTLNVLQTIYSDGSIVMGNTQPDTKKEKIEFKEEVSIATIQQPVETAVEEVVAENIANVTSDDTVAIPENLLDTITSSDETISLRILTLAQYTTYSRVELLKFLKAVSASLPDDVVSQIDNEKNISKRTLIEIIEKYILSD
jgi:hypothetical protein